MTALFAILFQGHVPVKGVNVTSVVNQDSQYQASIESYEKQNHDLAQGQSSLESLAAKQSDEIKSLKEALAKVDPEAVQEHSQSHSDKEASSSKPEGEGEEAKDESTTNDSTTAANNDEEKPAEEATSENTGTFVVEPGESAESVASRLEAEGYISSADEFIELMYEWDLTTMLQAGSYDLHHNMDPNSVAEALTHGAYYYIP